MLAIPGIIIVRWNNRKMGKAKVLMPLVRRITKKGNLLVMSIYQVVPSLDCPTGICPSFQLISGGERVIAYEYNNGEGYHHHYLKKGVLVNERIVFINLRDTHHAFNKEVTEFEK